MDITGSLAYEPDDDILVRRSVARQVLVTLTATVRSNWTAALKPEIDLEVDRNLTATSDPVTLSRTVGSSLFLPTLVVLGPALVALVLAVWRRRRDQLDGVLVVSTGAEFTELARFELHGHKTVLDGDGLPGRGSVIRHRTVGGARGGLKISYSNAPGTRPPVTGRCNNGDCLILGGLHFSHLANGD